MKFKSFYVHEVATCEYSLEGFEKEYCFDSGDAHDALYILHDSAWQINAVHGIPRGGIASMRPVCQANAIMSTSR